MTTKTKTESKSQYGEFAFPKWWNQKDLVELMRRAENATNALEALADTKETMGLNPVNVHKTIQLWRHLPEENPRREFADLFKSLVKTPPPQRSDEVMTAILRASTDAFRKSCQCGNEKYPEHHSCGECPQDPC